MKLGDVAATVGKGLFAGAAGTAAMMVSSTAEMRPRGRGASPAPADAAGKVLGVGPTEEGRARFSSLVHRGYVTAWRAAHGLIAATGLGGRAATAAHFGAVWGSEQVMLPGQEVWG